MFLAGLLKIISGNFTWTQLSYSVCELLVRVSDLILREFSSFEKCGGKKRWDFLDSVVILTLTLAIPMPKQGLGLTKQLPICEITKARSLPSKWKRKASQTKIFHAKAHKCHSIQNTLHVLLAFHSALLIAHSSSSWSAGPGQLPGLKVRPIGCPLSSAKYSP